MKNLVGLVILALAVCAPAQQLASPAAQTPVPATDQASREDVFRLFKVMRLTEQMESMQKTMIEQMVPAMEKTLEEEIPDATPEEREKMQALMKQTGEDAVNMYPVHEMIDDFIPVYQRNYTKSDIDAITGFYSSPAGQRLLEKQPQVMQDAMSTIMPKMQQRMKGMMERMSKQAQELAKPSQKTSPPSSQSPQPH